MDAINKLLTGYNNTVHSTIGMPSSKVNPSNNYSVWKRMHSFWGKILKGSAKYKVGDRVRITKEKVKLAKGYEKKLAPSRILREAKIAYYARNMFEAGRFFL